MNRTAQIAGVAFWTVCAASAVAQDWTVVSQSAGVTTHLYVSEDFLMRGTPWDSDGIDACPPEGADDVRCEWKSQHAPTVEHQENGVLAAVLDGSGVQNAVLRSAEWTDGMNTSSPWHVNYDVHFVAVDPNDIARLRVMVRFQAAGVTELTLNLSGQSTTARVQFRNAPTHTWTETPETSTHWRIELTLSRTLAGSPAMIWVDNLHVTEGTATYYDETFSLLPADLNCDDVVNFDDIDPFVLALADPVGYAAAYPECDYLRADMNADGLVNFDDIDGFVAALSGV